MSRKPSNVGLSWGLSLAVLALLGSCARQHPGPEAGDSVTNWLRSCANDRACHGDAVCLNAVCSVSCAATAQVTCVQLAEDAICDTSARMCDLPCETASTCRTLGPDFVCRDGRCRQEDPDNSAADEAASFVALPILADSERRVDDVAWQPVVVSERTQTVFARDASNTLTVPGLGLRPLPPFVTFQDDHFRVVWSIDTGETGARLRVIDVDPAGLMAARTLTVSAESSLITFPGNGQRVAHLGTDPHTANACRLSLTDLDSAESSAPWSFPCGGATWVAPVPESQDWLVTWSSIVSWLGENQTMRVARYDPTLSGWSAGPWEFGSYPQGTSYQIVAVGRDAWAWPRDSSSELYRLRAVADPAPVALTFAPRVQRWRLDEGDFRTAWVAPVAEGVLVLEAAELSQLRTTTISAAGARVRRDELPAGPVSRPARIPELGLLAMCEFDAGVSLRVLDEQGAPAAPRIQVDDASDSIGGFGSCDLAWSGSELMVVWTATQEPGGGGDYSVRARLVDLPALVSR